MGKLTQETKQVTSFIRQVSILHGDRLHIEVPKDKRDKFEPGDTVRVEKMA
jgi:hypothetical protein